MVYELEKMKYHINPALSLIHNRHIEVNTQIFDLLNGSVRKMAGRQCMNLLKMSAALGQNYYPETMGTAYVVNAPFVFSALFAIIKGFLNERTRSKIRIMGSNYRPFLLS